VSGSDDFEVVQPEPDLFIYSFRYAPAPYRAETAYLDWLNQRIADEIQASGFAFIMTSAVRGQTVLRMSICSHRTTLEDIEAVFARLTALGEGLVKGSAEQRGDLAR
jgi:aromatic-L-amino-acid/L-tryptophan decarboxylase